MYIFGESFFNGISNFVSYLKVHFASRKKTVVLFNLYKGVHIFPKSINT